MHGSCYLVTIVRVASNREIRRRPLQTFRPRAQIPLFPGKPVIITKAPEIMSLQWTPEFIAKACGKVLCICSLRARA